jgi:hypothetical protein
MPDVAACDVYVVLVALRYGYIPADNNPAGKSITEMEYDKAVETRRPKLAFMLDIDDEDFGWPPKRCDKDWQDANSNIARFRERVGNELGRALFTTPESLPPRSCKPCASRRLRRCPPASAIRPRSAKPTSTGCAASATAWNSSDST